MAGTPTPSLAAIDTSPEANAPKCASDGSFRRDPHLAGSARLVDFVVDEPNGAFERALDAGQSEFGRHAYGEALQELLRHVGFEIDRAVLDDAKQRLADGGRRCADSSPSGG